MADTQNPDPIGGSGQFPDQSVVDTMLRAISDIPQPGYTIENVLTGG